MTTARTLRWVIGAAVAAVLAACASQMGPEISIRSASPISAAVVTSAGGPEAGVWVIAETTDLPTKYAKMVVTDERGRYVVPGLPKATYSVWVRGYGLVDSPKVRAEPGKLLNLTAVPAPNEAAAAQYYPAIYWYSMLEIPPASEFGGSTRIPKERTQADWLKQMKNIGCIGCHQLGQASTRTIPAAFAHVESSEEAWVRRLQAGQSGEQMTNQLAGNFAARAVQVLRRVDRPHRQGRAAVRQAAAAAGRRAQRRRHFLGVEHREALSARPDRLGPAQSDGQRLRPALRLARVLDRQHADPGSEDEQGHHVQDAGGRSGHAGSARARARRERAAARALGLLGRGKALGHARQQPQRDVRQAGPRVDRGDGARPAEPRVLQEGLGSSVGQGVPARDVVAPGGDARPEDDEVHASSTPASARITRSSATTPTTRSG